MISHNEAQTLISARQDQVLDPIVERELNAHLATCDMCRAFAQSTDSLTQGLRTLPYMPASPAVRDAVMGRVEQGRSPFARLAGAFNTAPGPAFSTLAIIALVLIVGFFALNRFVLQGDDDPGNSNQQQLASQPTEQAPPTDEPEVTVTVEPTEEASTLLAEETPEPTATTAPELTESEDSQAAAAATEAPTEEVVEEPTDEPTAAPTEEPVEEEAAPTETPEPTATTAPEPTAEPEPTATEPDGVGGMDETISLQSESTPVDDSADDDVVDLTTEAGEQESTPVPTVEPTVAESTPVPTTAATPTVAPTEEAAPTETPAPTAEPTATPEPTAEPTEEEAPPIVPIDGGEPDDDAGEEPEETEPTETPAATEETASDEKEASDSSRILPVDGDGAAAQPIEPMPGEDDDEVTPEADEPEETPVVESEPADDDVLDLSAASTLYQDIAGEGDRLLLTDEGRMVFGTQPHAPSMVTEAGRSLETQDAEGGVAVALCDEGGACVDVSSGSRDGAATDTPLGVMGGEVLYARSTESGVEYRRSSVEGETVLEDAILLQGDGSISPQGGVYSVGGQFWIPTAGGDWVLLDEAEGTVLPGGFGAPQLVRFAGPSDAPIVGYVAGGQLIIAPAGEPGSPNVQIPFSGVDFDISPTGDQVAISTGSRIDIYDMSGSLVSSYASEDLLPGTLLWLNGGIVYLDTGSGALYQIPETGI